MAQGALYRDAKGKIISANPAAERMLGLTLKQMQGMETIDHPWRAIHEDGSDYSLKPGNTWIVILGSSSEITSDGNEYRFQFHIP